jgi:hypothetical protein
MDGMTEVALERIKMVSSHILAESLAGKQVMVNYLPKYEDYYTNSGVVLYENGSGLCLMYLADSNTPNVIFVPWSSILTVGVTEPDEQEEALYKLAKKHSRNPAGFTITRVN